MLSSRHEPRIDWRFWLAVALAAAVYGALCVRMNFVADDAFISFRYARNLARGLGLVFNPGERVEGYTNFLLVILLAGLHKANTDLVNAGRVVSAGAGVACIVLTAILARRWLRVGGWLPGAAAALVAVNPYVAAWGGSGLETTLFTALLLLSILPLVCREVSVARFVAASVAALCASLARPEGAALYGALLVGVLVLGTEDSAGARVRLVAPGALLFLVLGGAYFAWRWQYFGEVLPNTFFAKAPFAPRQAVVGAFYLASFIANPYVFVQVVFASGRIPQLTGRGRLPLLVLACLVVLVVAEGGDGLPMYRFLVPAVPLLALLVSARVADLGASCRPRLIRAIAVMAVPVVLALSFFPNADTQYLNFVHQRDHEIPRWQAAGQALGRVLPPGALVAAVPIGAIGWYSDLRVLDMLGLTDRTIARRPLDPAIGWTGHQKHDGAYVLARRPDALLLGNVYVDANPALAEFPFVATSAAGRRERDVFEQPRFRSDYHLVSLPIGRGWYLHYFARAGPPEKPR